MGITLPMRRAAATQRIFSLLRSEVYEAAANTSVYRSLRMGVPRVAVHVRWGAALC